MNATLLLSQELKKDTKEDDFVTALTVTVRSVNRRLVIISSKTCFIKMYEVLGDNNHNRWLRSTDLAISVVYGMIGFVSSIDVSSGLINTSPEPEENHGNISMLNWTNLCFCLHLADAEAIK